MEERGLAAFEKAADVGAVALYEALGFRVRARMCFTILARDA